MDYGAIITVGLLILPVWLKAFLFIAVLVFPKHFRPHTPVTVITAFILGLLFILGIHIFMHQPKLRSYGVYLISLSAYHCMEFLYVFIFRKEEVRFDYFLLNQSIAYMGMEIFINVEYMIEYYYGMPKWNIISAIFLPLLICGHVMRIGPMLQIGRNFNHFIEMRKTNDHVLITTGFYSLVRHPSYLGWSIWCISLSTIMLSPLSIFLSVIACIIFFRKRIGIEDIMMVRIFGSEYNEYMKKVPSFNPFGHFSKNICKLSHTE